jgi:hypothetical protein
VEFRFNRTVDSEDVVVNGSVVTRETIQEVWSMTQVNSTSPYFSKREVQFVSLNAEILTGIVSTITSSGILGFYVSIVLAVGRFLRIALTNLSHRPIYEDMAECEELLSFCMDIYMAREDKDLELEENLWRELIELYRSPERMILRTDPKGKRRFMPHPVKSKKQKKTQNENIVYPSSPQLSIKSVVSSPQFSDDIASMRRASLPQFGEGGKTGSKRKLD